MKDTTKTALGFYNNFPERVKPLLDDIVYHEAEKTTPPWIYRFSDILNYIDYTKESWEELANKKHLGGKSQIITLALRNDDYLKVPEKLHYSLDAYKEATLTLLFLGVGNNSFGDISLLNPKMEFERLLFLSLLIGNDPIFSNRIVKSLNSNKLDYKRLYLLSLIAGDDRTYGECKSDYLTAPLKNLKRESKRSGDRNAKPIDHLEYLNSKFDEALRVCSTISKTTIRQNKGD